MDYGLLGGLAQGFNQAGQAFNQAIQRKQELKQQGYLNTLNAQEHGYEYDPETGTARPNEVTSAKLEEERRKFDATDPEYSEAGYQSLVGDMKLANKSPDEIAAVPKGLSFNDYQTQRKAYEAQVKYNTELNIAKTKAQAAQDSLKTRTTNQQSRLYLKAVNDYEKSPQLQGARDSVDSVEQALYNLQDTAHPLSWRTLNDSTDRIANASAGTGKGNVFQEAQNQINAMVPKFKGKYGENWDKVIDMRKEIPHIIESVAQQGQDVSDFQDKRLKFANERLHKSMLRGIKDPDQKAGIEDKYNDYNNYRSLLKFGGKQPPTTEAGSPPQGVPPSSAGIQGPPPGVQGPAPAPQIRASQLSQDEIAAAKQFVQDNIKNPDPKVMAQVKRVQDSLKLKGL